jgi:hypothetical protein
MNKTYSMDGVQAILSYPFKLPGWQSKFLIGAALFFANYFIPILPGILVTGYFAQIMRAVIVDNAEPTLPEWDDWGKLFSRGFKVTCATTIYLLPALLLIFVGYLMMYVPLIMSSFSSGSGYGPYSGMAGASIIGMLVGMGMLFLGLILYFPLLLILPPALTHLVAKDSFTAAFRITEWWAILRANFWGFFTAFAIITGVYMILLMIVYVFYFTIILCFLFPVGLSGIVIYLSVVSAPLLGEAYRKGVENLAAAAAK